MKLALALILPFFAVAQDVEQQDTKGSIKPRTPPLASSDEWGSWWCSNNGAVISCSWCCSGSQCTTSGSWWWWTTVCSLPPPPTQAPTSTNQGCLTDGETTDCGQCCEGIGCHTFSFGTFCVQPSQIQPAGVKPRPSSMVVAAPVFTPEE